jgi:peptidoglycan hydrolase CwlO-like protein
MNNNLPWFGLIGVIATIISIAVGSVLYLDKSRQLTSSEGQVQQLQTELASVKQQATAKDTQIQEMQKTIDQHKENLAQSTKENQNLRRDLDTLSQCLTGAVNLMTAVSNDNSQQAAVILGEMKAPCDKSDAVIIRLKASSGNEF